MSESPSNYHATIFARLGKPKENGSEIWIGWRLEHQWCGIDINDDAHENYPTRNRVFSSKKKRRYSGGGFFMFPNSSKNTGWIFTLPFWRSKYNMETSVAEIFFRSRTSIRIRSTR